MANKPKRQSGARTVKNNPRNPPRDRRTGKPRVIRGKKKK